MKLVRDADGGDVFVGDEFAADGDEDVAAFIPLDVGDGAGPASPWVSAEKLTK